MANLSGLNLRNPDVGSPEELVDEKPQLTNLRKGKYKATLVDGQFPDELGLLQPVRFGSTQKGALNITFSCVIKSGGGERLLKYNQVNNTLFDQKDFKTGASIGKTSMAQKFARVLGVKGIPPIGDAYHDWCADAVINNIGKEFPVEIDWEAQCRSNDGGCGHRILGMTKFPVNEDGDHTPYIDCPECGHEGVRAWEKIVGFRG